MAEFDSTLADEFSISYTMVKLSNLPDYTTTFSVNGVTLFMSVTYNQRQGRRYISLETKDTEVLLSQTCVVFGRRCELNTNAQFEGLDYYVTLKPKDEALVFSNNQDYLNWADDFELCFVGWDYSFTERKKENIRVRRIGN